MSPKLHVPRGDANRLLLSAQRNGSASDRCCGCLVPAAQDGGPSGRLAGQVRRRAACSTTSPGTRPGRRPAAMDAAARSPARRMSSRKGANCEWISMFRLICGLCLASSSAMADQVDLAVAQGAVLQGQARRGCG